MKPILKLSGLLLGSLAFLGCRAEQSFDLPPLTMESERARFGVTYDEWQLCSADLAEVDAHIERIETTLGRTVDEKIDIYFTDELPCGTSPFACYIETENGHSFIATGSWTDLSHELVHAVSGANNYPSTFWSEGAANALSGRGNTACGAPLEPAELDATSSQDISYGAAGAFVRWQFETYDRDLVLGVLLNGISPDSAYGLDIGALVAKFNTDSPYSYPPYAPIACSGPALTKVEPGVWSEELTFSCDSNGSTATVFAGATQRRTVRLENDGVYELVTRGGQAQPWGAQVSMVGCDLEIVIEEPPLLSHGDLRNQAEACQTGQPTRFPHGKPQRLELTAGTYEIEIGSGTYDLHSVSVRLEQVE